jgi:hypothetical protein
MMAMPKLPVVVLTPPQSIFVPMPKARFSAGPMTHVIVRTNTSTMVKTKYARHKASTSIQAL